MNHKHRLYNAWKLVPETRWFWILLTLACTLAWLVYWPGLKGGFLFDDWANLNALGAYGPVDNWSVFWRYITSGTADPTGRPLALLSFLVDARDWPAAALPFKRSNVILHVLNGVLLALFLRRLGHAACGNASARRINLAAILAAALWLLHPLMVSTTLYIVQREAMLPATFALMGFMGYLAGRERFLAGQRSGLWLAIGSIMLATALATASKANGVLLPLLTLVIDRILPISTDTANETTRRWRRVRLVLLGIPSAALLGYLLYKGIAGMLTPGPVGNRPWSIAERLLTEARVLLDYLRLLLIPQPYSHGLFNDQILASRSLFSPMSTLWCVLAIGAILILAVAVRKRLPLLSTAIGFYFCGHLLESTVLPLELYYEHRNYLPAMLLFWPLAWWLSQAWEPDSPPRLRHLRRLLSIALPVLFALLAWLRCDLWGNRVEQALMWAQLNPQSPRAQAFAAFVEIRLGHPAAAIARLDRAMRPAQASVQLSANLVDASCDRGLPLSMPLAKMQAALLHTGKADSLAFAWLNRKLDNVQAKSAQACPSLVQIQRLVAAWSGNPRVQASDARRSDARFLEGRIQLVAGQPHKALVAFDASMKLSSTPAKALRQAALLADAGFPRLGLEQLAAYTANAPPPPTPGFGMPWIHQWVLKKQGYWATEFSHLRQALAASTTSAATSSPATHPASD